jgi:hypothetical protein
MVPDPSVVSFVFEGNLLNIGFNLTSFMNFSSVIEEHSDIITKVQEELKVKNIEFVGLHYTGALSLPREIDEKLVEFQYEYLMKHGEWLSDHQEVILLKNK